MTVRAAPGWGFPGSIPGSALLANPGGLQISKGLVMNELEKEGASVYFDFSVSFICDYMVVVVSAAVVECCGVTR